MHRLGGDPITGLTFIDALRMFEEDAKTSSVLMIGEIGGTAEEEAAVYIKTMSKPVFAYIAGMNAPQEMRMGHAGAIISSGRGTAMEKIESLNDSGVTIITNPAWIGKSISKMMGKE